MKLFTILIVDDNANNRYTMRSILENLEDCRILEAASGEDTLSWVVEESINLILLDVQMPGMDGFETARLLNLTQRGRDIPVIFVTAFFKAEEFARHGFALGAIDYLTKPVDDSQLLNRIYLYRKVLDRQVLLEDALENLRRSQAQLERRHQLIVESATDGIYELDHNGRIVFINATALKLLGYNKKDVMGHRAHTIFHHTRIDGSHIEYGDSPSTHTLKDGTSAVVDDELFYTAEGRLLPVLYVSLPVEDGGPESRGALVLFRDISDLKSAERRMREAIESIPDAFLLFDAKDNLRQFNHRLVALFPALDGRIGPGDPFDALLAMMIEVGIATEESLDNWKKHHRSERHYGRLDLEIELAGNRWAQIAERPTSDNGLVCTLTDISEKKAAERAFRYRATFDTLTGLLNRTAFLSRLREEIATAARREDRLAIVFVDLDRFKVVNDTFGHMIGDQLLTVMGKRLKNCLSTNDVVGRFGGDEFTVILTELTDPFDALPVVERMIAQIAEPQVLSGRKILLTASVGVSIFPDDDTDPQALLRNADLAMYQAKERGRNTLEFFTPDLTDRANQFMEIGRDLRLAVPDELVVHYQPIINLREQSLFGLEALVRWQPPTKAIRPPQTFLQIAEETNLIEAIDTFVLRQATTDLIHRADLGKETTKANLPAGTDPLLFVNLSPVYFHNRATMDHVLRFLDDNQFPMERLVLEVGESVLLQESKYPPAKPGALVGEPLKAAANGR